MAFHTTAHASSFASRLKSAVVAAAVSLASLAAFGWGGGHDDVAKLYGEFMPAEIKAFLGDEGGTNLTRWCHHPDHFTGHPDQTLDMTGAIVGDVDKAIFREFGYSNGDWLHRHTGRAAMYSLLRKAFKEGNARNAAFYLSVISHSVSDQGAINHTPILQFMYYSCFKDVDYGWKRKCEFTLTDADVARRVRESLRAYSPKVYAPVFKDAVVAMAIDDCYRQAEASAEIEIDAAFGTREQYVAAMSKIVTVQLTSLLDIAWTCWTLRDEPSAFTAADCRLLPPREEQRRRLGNPQTQAVWHGIFDKSLNPAKPKSTVGLVCDPYGSFHVTSLSYVGKMLTAAAGRTLRDAGYAVRGVSFWDMEYSDLPPPAEMPALFIDLGWANGMTKRHAETIARYAKAGGRLFVVGGFDRQNVSGLGARLVAHSNAEIPVSLKWDQEEVGDWASMRFAFSPEMKRTGAGPFPLVRNPNFNGFCKPFCRFSVKTEGTDLRPLATLTAGGKTVTVGVCDGKVCWMPEYFFLPFLFSQDRTVDWADMRLDSFASKVLLDAMDVLLAGVKDVSAPAKTRYGVKVVKAKMAETAAPSVSLPPPWKMLEGDDALTGLDVRDFYFTIEAPGAGLPAPEVSVAWPGVAIKRVVGAKDVKVENDRASFRPTAKKAPTHFSTHWREGGIFMGIFHNVEGVQHGPYAGKPFPEIEARAQLNWQFAARELFKLIGLGASTNVSKGWINVFGFESNYPNGHVDSPPHFHVMLMWEEWKDNSVGHFHLDGDGFIVDNVYAFDGRAKMYCRSPKGHEMTRPGDPAVEFRGSDGNVSFRIAILQDGDGLIVTVPGRTEEWTIESDAPDVGVFVRTRSSSTAPWRTVNHVAVKDDVEKGVMTVLFAPPSGGSYTETFNYDPDTGRLLK